MREHSRQASLIREHVDQSPADHDSVTHAKCFQWRGEQHASAHGTREVEVVGYRDVVDHGLENTVYVALGRKQSGGGEALDDIVFRLLLPLALGLERRRILGGGAFIIHAVHADLGEFVVLATLLEVVAPDAGLGFESNLIFHASAEVAFFAVDVGGHPVSRNQVQSPAIHVEEVGIPRRRSIGTVEADDAKVLVFHPDAPEEASLAGVLLGCYVEYQAADVAQEFAADVVELIVRTVEVGAIGIDHPGEANGLVLHLEEPVETTQEAGLHALIVTLQIVLAIDRLAHIHSAKEVVVLTRYRAELRIGAQILQVGLNQRSAAGESLHEAVFALDEAIHDLIHSRGPR